MQHVFVDGGHLRVAYGEVMCEFFGETDEIDYTQLPGDFIREGFPLRLHR